MADAFAPGLAVEEDIEVEKVRELPLAGRVLCKVGDRVSADTVVLEADLPGDLFLLRIAEQLSIDASEVREGLRIKEGQEVREGDLVCEHKGIFSFLASRYLSPASGTVELIAEQTGHVGLRMPSHPLKVVAHISGEVVACDDSKSVTVRTRAAFVQGIFGIGGERRGVLEPLGISPSERLTPAALPGDCRGKILVGGTRPTAETLRAAATAGAVGIVCGSLDDEALQSYLGYDIGIALTGDEDIPLTLIATEGFGELALGSHVWSLLSTHRGRLASISGATQVRAGAVRPEVIVAHSISQSAEASPSRPADALGRGLSVGAQVRLIRVPYFGNYAEVVELPVIPELLATGAKTRVLRARLESGEVVTVPRANVELL